MKHIIILSLFTLWGLGSYLSAQSSNQNYILTRTYQENDASKWLDQIQYLDGLGRPIETVQKAISGITSKDLVTFTEYDSVGREYRHWLPTPSSASTGEFIAPTTFTSNANSFYNTLTNDSNPYTESLLEASPLNRILGQKNPGAAWQSHPTGVSYLTNAADVAYYLVNANNKLVRSGTYPAGTLYKTISTDEDAKTNTEYKDKLGQVVMKQSSTNVNTYYVYNDFGQLSYVLPPIAADSLPVAGEIPDNHGVLQRYAYIYKYDERGNNVMKRLPGCDSISMVYDKAERLVLSQDGNQRKKGKWMATVYDVFGRVLYTGQFDSSSKRKDFKPVYDFKVVTENYIHYSNFYNTGYSNTNFPTLAPLIVNYYDNYSFTSITTNGSNLNWVTPPTGYDAQYGNAKGLLTGTRTYILDKTGTYLAAALYYDQRGRVVQSRSSNQLAGYDYTYNHYDFTGRVVNTRKEHISSRQALLPEVYTYTYDNAGRLKNTTYNSVILSSITYDELGRPTTKLRHNATDTETFAYNIHNWTTKLTSAAFEEELFYNNPAVGTACFNGNIALSTWTYAGVKKTYKYTYDLLNRLTVATSTPYSFWESFGYDKQGNILNLYRKKDGGLIDNLAISYVGNQVLKINDTSGSKNQAAIKEYNSAEILDKEFDYDANGNMTKDLDRNIVTIRYNVLNLPDTIQFKNGNQIINRYAADGRKLGTEYFTKVVGIILPIDKDTVCNWTYSAGVVDQRGTVYIDNKEYSTSKGIAANTILFRTSNAEGYFSNGCYFYNRKDHLGNIREVWNSNYNLVQQRTQYYPSGLPWASNSGDNPGTQNKKYNGKEFVEMHGYDTFDYGWRGMYPAICRFSTVDLLAEKYYSISPYAYCAGNPVNAIDPNGMEVKNGNEEELKKRSGQKDAADKKWNDLSGGKSKAELKSGGKWNKELRKADNQADKANDNWRGAVKNYSDAQNDIKTLETGDPKLFNSLNTMSQDVYIGRSNSSIVSLNGGALNQWSVSGTDIVSGGYIDGNKLYDTRNGFSIWSNSGNIIKLKHESGHILSYTGNGVGIGIPQIPYGTAGMPNNIYDLYNNFKYLLNGNCEDFRHTSVNLISNPIIRAAIIAEQRK